jgi:hypothetical protein
MPNWRNTLPPAEKHMGFDLKRTPATTPIHAIITCDDLLVADTHFYHGRTLPCERNATDENGEPAAATCTACNDAIPYRTHVYVSAYDPRTALHFIFECTAHAAKPLADYRAATGTLRGCIIHATRPKGLKNARVTIETNTANLTKNRIPEPPNVILAMATIWRLPQAAVPVEHQRHRRPTVRPNATRLRQINTQPDNADGTQTLGQILASIGNGKPK